MSLVEYWRCENKGRDKSIDWFSNKFNLPLSAQKLNVPNQVQEEEYDDVNDYLPTEYVEGGFDLKVHPHWLTGAKGYETTFLNIDSLHFNDDDEDFEDLIITESRKVDNIRYRDSDQLTQLDELSEDSQEVYKLALDTEEDDQQKHKFINLDKMNSYRETNAISTRVSVINSMMLSPEIKQYNRGARKYTKCNNGSRSYLDSISGNLASQNEFELVLQQSPEKVQPTEGIK